MKKKLFYIFTGLFLTIIIYASYCVFEYVSVQKHNQKEINFCSNENRDCYNKMFELLLPKMLIHKVKIDSKTPELLRLDWSARLLSDYALSKADVLISYGVGYDITFENNYAKIFHKPVYSFDCGISVPPKLEAGCYFYSECIETNDFAVEFPNQTISNKVHKYTQMLEKLKLTDKKVFIKMDIAGAEKAALPQIIDNSDNITGLTIAFYFNNVESIIESLPILDKLNEKFILLSRNSLQFTTCPVDIQSKYYKGGPCNYLFVFSYVNKNIVDKEEISWIQKTTNLYKYKSIDENKYYPIIDNNISLVVVLVEKLKQLKAKLYKLF